MTAPRRPAEPGLRRFTLRSIALPWVGAGLAAVVGLTASCGKDAPAVAGAAERNGVRVEVRFDGDVTGDGAVLVTFTPQQQGFHLYSTDLPAQGVDGVGRPTRVELTACAGRKVTSLSRPLPLSHPVRDVTPNPNGYDVTQCPPGGHDVTQCPFRLGATSRSAHGTPEGRSAGYPYSA